MVKTKRKITEETSIKRTTAEVSPVQSVLSRYLVGVVVSCMVKVVAHRRGQHDEQVNAVHLSSQVSEPDQTIHLVEDQDRAENTEPLAQVLYSKRN